MNEVISSIRNNAKVKKILYILNCVFLFLYVFSIPSFSGRETYNLISYAIMIFLTLLTFLYTFLYSKFSFKWRLLIVPFFTSWALIGTIVYSHEFRSWLTIFLLSFTFFVFYFCIKNINKNFLVLYIISCSLFAFSLYFFIVYKDNLLSFFKSGERLGSFFSNVNELGGYSLVGVVFSLYIVVFDKNKFRFTFIIPAISLLAVGILTGSRTFLIEIVVVTIVILFIKLKKHLLIFLISIVCFVALFLILINLDFMSSIKDKLFDSLFTLTGIGGGSSDGSTLQRWLWQLYGINLGSKNIFIGYGCGGFSIYSGVGTYSHAQFSELLCNFGLPGLFSYYLCFVYPFILMFKSTNKMKYLCAIFMFVQLIYSFLNITFYQKDTYLIISILFICVDDFDLKKMVHRDEELLIYYEVKI